MFLSIKKGAVINIYVVFLSVSHLSVDFPEYILTEEFCRKHFLTGLLLRELGLALQDEQDLRHLALACLKNLMAKHSLDSRYGVKVTPITLIKYIAPFMLACELQTDFNCIVFVCAGETGTDSLSVLASLWFDP